MSLREDALHFAQLLQEQYYHKRDLMSLADCLSEQISWIGSGETEICHSLAELLEMLSQDAAEYSGSFTVELSDLQAVELDERCCVVYGRLRARPDLPTIAIEELRLSLVVCRYPQGLHLMHAHFSRADWVQEDGRYFLDTGARANNKTLRRDLEIRDKLLQSLTDHIPGGMHQCSNDPYFSLLSVSDSFVNMFGYSRDELVTRFDSKFIDMVYPEDRANMLRRSQEQLQHGRDIEVEYRVLHKSGKPIWVLDKGRLLDDGQGGQYFYCLLIEITERKREQEQLRLALEKHQVITDQATDIIFEWDILQDTLSFSPNWRKKFGYDAIATCISHRIPLSDNVHPDDLPAFIRLMTETGGGSPYNEAEFRICTLAGQFLWCRVRATAQFDDYGHPVRAIGVIVDIDADKRQKQALLEQAQHDALTGLYNKAAVNSLVPLRIQAAGRQSLQALMILDLDRFKAINDTYGHLCGDSLLSDAAVTLKGHLRSSDIAGRIGGDEFLIYLSEVTDLPAALAKAHSILAALQQLTPAPGAPPISCSMGLATSLCHNADYLTLYSQADQALYHQKKNGRSGVAHFDPASFESDGAAVPDACSIISAMDNDAADEQLPQYVFRALYEAQDTAEALERVLEIIGRSYDVSRVYIFESSLDLTRASMTFEWCNEGVSPQRELLQNYSYKEDLGDYLRNFDAEGIFYCHDISKVNPALYEILSPQGIRSMLQCGIIKDGAFLGGIGFDEGRENRHWSEKLIASFKLTAQIIATFLLQMRLLRLWDDKQ